MQISFTIQLIQHTQNRDYLHSMKGSHTRRHSFPICSRLLGWNLGCWCPQPPSCITRSAWASLPTHLHHPLCPMGPPLAATKGSSGWGWGICQWLSQVQAGLSPFCSISCSLCSASPQSSVISYHIQGKRCSDNDTLRNISSMRIIADTHCPAFAQAFPRRQWES